MNMKNTVILLLFLLSVLGIILGVYYTEADVDSVDAFDGKEVVTESDDGTITIIIEEPELNECTEDYIPII